MTAMTYPFTPKSTRLLLRGQFWAIPLDDGRFGAGCVVGAHENGGKGSSRMFIGGLVSWIGTTIPSDSDLHDLPLVEIAFAHLKVITESGGVVLGQAEIRFGDAPLTMEALSLPTWGFRVPKLRAEKLARSVKMVV